MRKLLFLPAAVALCLAAAALCGGTSPSEENGDAPPTEKKYKTFSETYGFLRAEILDLVPKDEKKEEEPWGSYYRRYEKPLQPMGGLRAADFDGDGLCDFLIRDPQNRQFVIYFGKKSNEEKNPESKTPGKGDDDKNPEPEYVTKDYERVEVKTSSDARVYGFTDVNSDGKPDLVFIDDEGNIVVRFQEESRKFADDDKVELPARYGKARFMRIADMDKDGAEDVIAINQKFIIIIKPTKKGILKEHAAYQNTSGKTFFQLADLNGDGLLDLVLGGRNRPQDITVRLQEKGGGFDIEYTQTVEGIRMSGRGFADIDGDGRDEMTAFLERIPGVRAFKFMTCREVKKEAGALEDFHFGSMHAFPFENTGSKSMAIGDINGDDRNDIVVLDSAAAQILVYRQGESGSLEEREEYPSLSEGDEVAIADIDGDGLNEFLVLSREEGAIGACKEDETGKIDFPKPLDTKHTPLSMAAGDLNGDGLTDLVYAAKNKDDDGFIFIMLQNKDGEMASGGEIELSTNQILSLRKLQIADINADGKADIIALLGTRVPLLLIQGNDAGFEDAAKKEGFKPGLLAKFNTKGFSLGDVDNDGRVELIVCRKNFARAMQLSDGALEVVDQYTGDTAESRILKVVTVDLNRDGRNEILMLDESTRKLSIRERTEKGIFKTAKDLDMERFVPFNDIILSDMDGDGAPDIVMFGDDKFGILYAGARDPRFEEIGGYRTEIKKCRYAGMKAGDVNGDGKTDLVLIDGGSHNVEILSFREGGMPQQELTFKVFERESEKYSYHRGGGKMEPSELLLADVDGDGRLDIVILVNKKVVIYPQEP